MDPLCSSFGKVIVLPFLGSLAFIGITVNAGIKGSFKCTPPPMPYGGGTDGPNSGGTDGPNGDGTDATNGGGTDATNDGGTDATNGGGTDATSGEGTDATNGGGTDATNGGGTDATNGGGTDATNGEGTDATNGEGTDATNGGGTDATSGEGTDGNGGGSDVVLTCEKGGLPEVHNGSFDCPGQISLNNTCNLTCDVGFYPVSANTTTCELRVTGHPIGSWSSGTFDCHDCSGQWDGSIYRFYVINMTHTNATNKCQGVGSAIAYIESLEENLFVHELVKKCAPDNGQWAGWTWIDADISNTTGYTNWDAGEPDHGEHAPCVKEECAVMKYDSGKWHDHCCNREFYPVCEQNI